jgi:D-alanyl-D-alanine carboxypeptidase
MRWLLILLPFIMLVFCLYWYMQPLGTVSSKNKVLSVQTPAKVVMTWPAGSQAAIGSIDQGVIAVKPNQTPKPTASTAKVITALTVLQKKPLKLGEQGPKITLTQKDVDIYNKYFAQDGSVAKVEAGEQLTEYQMLQGMLLPSANNYADSLAIWAYGSLEQYQKASQKLTEQLEMSNTTVGRDASGFDPTTVSTAEDLTKLAGNAIKNEVIAEIVKQSEVNLPVAGVKQNTNWLLGADGVIGLKTGNTTEAGGVYIFASQYEYDKSHSTIIVGAVQGEPNVIAAIHQSRLLMNQAKPNYKLVKAVKKDQTIAVYSSSWGKTVNAVAAQDIEVLQWGGEAVKPHVELNNINAPAAKGTVVGTIKVGNSTTDVVLQDPLELPDWQWRVLRWL